MNVKENLRYQVKYFKFLALKTVSQQTLVERFIFLNEIFRKFYLVNDEKCNLFRIRLIKLKFRNITPISFSYHCKIPHLQIFQKLNILQAT